MDELRWLSAVITALRPRGAARGMPDPSLCAVKLAAADVLDRAATALDPGDASAADVIRSWQPRASACRRRLGELETRTTSLPLEQRRPGQDAARRGHRLGARPQLPRAGARLHHRPGRDQRRVRGGGLEAELVAAAARAPALRVHRPAELSQRAGARARGAELVMAAQQPAGRAAVWRWRCWWPS